jgi:SAM-dependent methyltransferase
MRHLQSIPPCRVLDIGCGPGALIFELSTLGYDAHGVDSSASARELGAHLEAHAASMTLRDELDESWKGTFDLLLSFEVIEHIEDDVGAMREWREYLKPGGRMILSTPAHPERWNAADEWAGHVRRYERGDLIQSVERAGFDVERIECYGFPLANVMEVLRARAYARKLAEKRAAERDLATLTGESGSDRSVDTQFWSLYSGALATLAMSLFCQVQRPFLNTTLGNGFIVVARRSES